MKTKTEYLKDLELTTLGDKKELKKHYRKLVKIYNLDNGTSKNELRIKEVHSAYEALLNDKYKLEEPLGGVGKNFNPEIEIERYNNAFFDFLNKSAIVIDLKKSDNKVVKIDNNYVNFDCSKLTKSKIVLVNKTQLIKFER
jgi:hypothetical protein